jgi:hypothetical protein
MSRPLFKLEQGANQFFNIDSSEDGPRATTTHGGVVSQETREQRPEETQRNRKEAAGSKAVAGSTKAIKVDGRLL